MYDTIFIAGVDGVVEKIEKLPIDLFAETVRCVITWSGHVQWEENHYKFVLKKCNTSQIILTYYYSSYLVNVLFLSVDCSDTSLFIFQLQSILVHLQDQNRAVDLIETCDVSTNLHPC